MLDLKKWAAVERRHLLQAARGAAAVAVASSVTLAVAPQLKSGGYEYTAQFATGGQWAVISIILTGTLPLLGGVAQVTAERVAGTVLGGFAGWGAFLLAGGSWAGLSALITLATFLGVASGEAARHGYAGRLFGITFALVAFGLAANDVGLALPLARILGIVIGIALAVLANAALLPRSGSEEALAALGGMLGALEDAARAAWGSADREAAGAGGAGAVTAAGAPGSVGAARAVWAWGGGAHSMAAAEAAADRLYGSSKTLDEALAVARYEIYAGRLGRHACLLPGGPCLPCATCKQLAPAARVCAAQRAARSAARVLWAINLALAQGWEDADWAVIVEIHHPSVLRRVASGAVGAAAALRRDYAAALAGRAWRDGGAPAGGKAAGAWRRRGAPAAADPAPAEEVLEELEAAVAELLRHTQENRHRYLLAATSWAASRRPGASAPVFTGVATAGGGGAGAPLPQPRLAETHAPPARPAEPFALFPDDARGLRVILRWRALCWDVEQLAVEFRGLRLALEALTLPGGRPAAPPPAGPAAAAGV